MSASNKQIAAFARRQIENAARIQSVIASTVQSANFGKATGAITAVVSGGGATPNEKIEGTDITFAEALNAMQVNGTLGRKVGQVGDDPSKTIFETDELTDDELTVASAKATFVS
ncbi:MAG: hypothetical protein AAF747_08560 [Planctomycetota bacterium]